MEPASRKMAPVFEYNPNLCFVLSPGTSCKGSSISLRCSVRLLDADGADTASDMDYGVLHSVLWDLIDLTAVAYGSWTVYDRLMRTLT